MKSALIWVLVIWGTASCAAAGPITQTQLLSPGGGFLARSSNDNSQLPSFYVPADFNLTSLGLPFGSAIQISFTSVDFCYAGPSMCFGPFLLGLFSSSASTSTYVAPGNGLSAVLTNQWSDDNGNRPGPNNTIAGDFMVTNGMILAIPSGGTSLFVGLDDSYFSDNVGTVNVTITQLSAMPEPAAYVLTLAGLAAIAARKYFNVLHRHIPSRRCGFRLH